MPPAKLFFLFNFVNKFLDDISIMPATKFTYFGNDSQLNGQQIVSDNLLL